MSRYLTIPEQMLDELVELPYRENEVEFALVYPEQDTTGLPSDQIGVCGGIVLAEGTPAEVSRSSTAEGLLRDLAGRAEDTDFDYLLGHTHSEGTVENHGGQYADGFSSGDLRSIDKEARRRGEPRYFEVLITPGRPVQMTDGTRVFDPDNWNIMASDDDVSIHRENWSDDNPPGSNMSSETFLQYNTEMREELGELADRYDVEFLTQ
jgi:hypothetical protein